jgi:hypothetical protein
MIWPDEFEVGVADDLLFVEGALRVLRADLAVLTFERLRQFTQVKRNAADRPHTCADFHRRDGAAERAIGVEEEVLHVFRQQAVLFALLHVGHEFAHVDIARGECHVVHVGPETSDLLHVCVAIDLRENLSHGATAREPVFYQRIEAHSRNDFPNDIIHAVAAQRFAHVVGLADQRAQDFALTDIVGNEILNHRLLLLPVALDTSDTLLQPLRTPRHIIIHYQGSELEVDPFPGGFSGDYCGRCLFKELPFGVDTFLKRHPTVNRATPEP